jgi:type II secretory pathway component GspD/PulD (secretin)
LVVPLLAGCRAGPPRPDAGIPESGARATHTLRYLSVERANATLELLGLTPGAQAPGADPHTLALAGTPEQLRIADLVLTLMDCREDYGIEKLGPASIVRKLPSNAQIAAALGHVAVGTFEDPPAPGARLHGIIDIHGDSVLAILPVRCRDRLHALLAGDPKPPPDPSRPATAGPQAPSKNVFTLAATDDGRPAQDPSASETVVTLVEMAAPSDPKPADRTGEQSVDRQGATGEPPKTVTISLTARPDPQGGGAGTATGKVLPANGDDVLAMTLPETITVIQLLDLVGKHVGLNYVYDPREINNQPIALKLHGDLRGEMRIKDLYVLLETVLDFMNLAMIRRQDNLVAVVPMDKALPTQPELIGGGGDTVQVGDTVVTRVFEIRHVDVSSVMSLLGNMKLSVAATPLDGGNLLLVTCHAGRMRRIEQLVEMIDCPGRPLECRFRRLSYVRATPLIARIRTLAGELEGIAVATPAPAAKPTTPPATALRPPAARPVEPVGRRAVFLDTDERTNRVLMIGFAEDLTLLEELIDILDVAQEDPRSPHIYTIRHVDAQQALDKLQKLEVFKSAPRGTAAVEAGAAGSALTEEPLVAVLETTNQLVVKAAPDQHVRIREFLTYIDVAPTDTRTIAAYRIRHIDVYAAKEALEGLDLVSVDTRASSFVAGPNQPSVKAAVPISQPTGNPLQKAPIVVSESTNTLLVKATPDQHARIAKIVQYIDRYTPEEEWTYQVYPLESSSPDHLAGLLERLIQETARDKDDKIERITPRTQPQIVVVPDPNTFSLIVYASQRSQKWIESLISRLDKRRPQVLIDVTLVEITRADTFEYDLNLVAGANNPVIGNLVVDPIQRADSGSRLEGGFNLLDQDGNPTGRTRAFYSDRHVQALLTAMQRKNYGRVLAKPKVLVDDGRKGQIVTTDTTTYVKESIQIPQVGTPITTREFVPIEASIELQITPHISEGNLLRLEVFMSRDDFGTRPLSGAPPDKATSEVTTTVFVPDDRTVILGGLVKLNQSKGGSKVPILGDLPLVGVVFRSIDNSDIEKKLYVFLKANIVRPYDIAGLSDLQEISEQHREAFERSESEFQGYESIPGITPEPMPPEGVLRDYK